MKPPAKSRGFMDTRYLMTYVLFTALVFVFFSCSQKTEPYLDTGLSFEERAEDLVSRMTLEEKISQMVYEAPAIERLDIPAYNWWNECLHGVGRAGLATVFPQSIGMAAMWDSEKMLRIAGVVSDEARAKHHDFASRGKRNIYQGLTFWTPNINIFRDPRWGRGMETYGEDPWLAGELAVQYIKGLQGDDPKYLKLVATAKHFVVHSGPEPDRHHFNAIPTDRDFVETYIPHFKRTVKEADVYSVMCAYNRLFGEPCCGSEYVESLLRDEWGFEGYIVSDCWAIRDFYNEGDHEVVNTVEEAAAMAVRAGTDLNCGNSYPALVEAFNQGLVTEEEINICVTRLMVARMKLGMFDPPSLVSYTSIPVSVVDSYEHQQAALEAARKSMVLLKNENDILPLDKKVQRVAVIGPNADNIDALLANYNGYPSNPITPYQGIKEKLTGATVEYAPGCPLAEEFPFMNPVPSSMLFTDISMSQNGLKASYFGNMDFEGDPVYEGVDTEIDFVWWTTEPYPGVPNDDFSVTWEGYLVPEESGRYSLGGDGFSAYEIMLEGETLVRFSNVHHPDMRYKDVWLEAGKPYEIVIKYQQKDSTYPMMKLVWDIPGQDMKEEAVELARGSDLVILTMGLSPRLEGEEMNVYVPGFAGGDRTRLSLPPVQTELIKEVMSLGKPTVLVLMNGSAVSFEWEAENVPAILEAWYPGQAGGEAIADVLFGDYNPAGRLPVTFYRSVAQLPPFDDYGMEGRTYKYFKGEPLYEFGYGLSYSTFEYDNLVVPGQLPAGEMLNVSVIVTNTGKMDGEEVVQLYLSFPDNDMAPIQTLQGFERVSLRAGETKNIKFSLDPEQMALYHEEYGLAVTEGPVMVSVGGKQPDDESIRSGNVVQKHFNIIGELHDIK
ncbi:MAG: glycoside hydrolase family 3 C-terminal domain-containing protein [Bacteroidales bacterium]